MLTIRPLSTAAMAPGQPVRFGSQGAAQEIPVEKSVALVNHGLPPATAQVEVVTDPEEMEAYLAQEPILMFMPVNPQPLNLANKVGFIVTAPSTSGTQGLSLDKLKLDGAQSSLVFDVKQNASGGGVSTVMKTVSLFLLVDKGNLPQNFQQLSRQVNVRTV